MLSTLVSSPVALRRPQEDSEYLPSGKIAPRAGGFRGVSKGVIRFLVPVESFLHE